MAVPRPLLLALTPLLLAATPLAAQPAEADLTLGKRVYREHCLECHGKKGEGDGDRARRLGFRPRDLSHGSFKCRCTPSGALPADEDLLRSVEVGLPGTSMRAFGTTLSLDERLAVVAYVKALSPRFATETAPACIDLPSPPAASSAAVAEGRQIYRALKCWRCHGLEGEGDGPAAAGLKDDWGESIRVFNFARLGKFKCGGTQSDLYRTLHTGLNGSPMPSYTEAFRFAREDVADLTALESAYPAEAVAEYAAWTPTQPERAAIGELSDEELRALADVRTWALIAYLQSLLQR